MINSKGFKMLKGKWIIPPDQKTIPGQAKHGSEIGEYSFSTPPIEGAMKVAMRFHVGDHKYGIGNWKGGNWEFILKRMDHAEKHWLLFKRDGNKYDDNLGAVLWAGYMLAWYEANRPEVLQEALNIINQRKVTYYGGNTKVVKRVRKSGEGSTNRRRGNSTNRTTVDSSVSSSKRAANRKHNKQRLPTGGGRGKKRRSSVTVAGVAAYR